MASNETYRVEIPIIINDQTEAPLRSAEERVSRFQRSAESRTRRIERDFGRLNRTRAEPIMRVRDQLTQSVLRADRLVRRLGTTQASPLIAVQDRASGIITRISAALTAMESGQVTVATEMRGDIIDQIVQARAALNDLGDVRAGPVAELRGELFGQLTRAMAEVQRLDQLAVEPRATLRERVTDRVRQIGSGLRGLTTRAWEVTIQARDRVTGVVRGIGRAITHPLSLLGVGGGVAGLTGAGLGMVMEKQDLVSAFEVLLGSRQAAEARMQELINFAGQTPFTRQEIWRSSRVLEVSTGGALSTGDELRRIGDVAAGTIQPFEDVAKWTGRLYAGLASGRPIGQAAASLEEMGAMSAETVERLQEMVKAGKGIAQTWPVVIKEFGRFDGLMEKQSKNLKNIMLGTKTAFIENVVGRWGQGVADVLQPALTRFRAWRSENNETVKQMGDLIEQFGRRVGGFLVGHTERATKRISDAISNPKFKHATFSEKMQILISAAFGDVIDEISGPITEKMTSAFTSLGEASAKAYVAGMKMLGVKAVENLKEGNLKEAAIPAGLMWLLGGGAIARTAWRGGRWAFDRGRDVVRRARGRATTVPNNAPEVRYSSGLFSRIRESGGAIIRRAGEQARGGISAARNTVGRIVPTGGISTVQGAAQTALSTTTRVLSVAGNVIRRVALPAAVGLEAYNIYKSDDKIKATAQGATGLISATTGAKIGAAIGTTILPGIGTIVGGLLGGAGGYVTGSFLGGKIVDVMRGPSAAEAAQRQLGDKGTMGIGTSEYLDQEVYEPFREHVNRAESWGRNLIGNFMRGRDSAGMSMGGWLNTKVYEPFRSIVNRATSWGRNLMNNFQSGISQVQITAPNVPQPVNRQPLNAVGLPRHAKGGILTRPHIGMVAEAGPEAIIPLSAGMRGRAMGLWEETGRRLGFMPYAEGGFAGTQQSLPIPVNASPVAMSGATILNLNFDLAGLVGQVVIENREGIDGATESITSSIANNLRAIFQNMPK